MEYEINWKNENCPEWHEGYQLFEDMKWALPINQTDIINSDTLDAFSQTKKEPTKANLGKWGHTIRPNGGEWDILGMEIHHGDEPAFVGLHGCVNLPAEQDLAEIDFRQFKFQYQRISDKTPELMPYSYAQALVSIAKGETNALDESVIIYLEKHGYIKKDGECYKPTFLVMFRSKNKAMSLKDLDVLKNLRSVATKIAICHYLFCREQIEKEIPTFFREDEYLIEHACANIFNLRGAILEEALH